jgi:predicted component of type VI protein secretion system
MMTGFTNSCSRHFSVLNSESQMQVLLRVNTASKPEKKIKVSRDVMIGREKGRCDLRVASSEVSRRHCQILVGEKTVNVRDLGSANGTRVNGELIPAKMNFPVNSGDLLEVGPLKIHVEFQGAEQRSRPAAKSDDDFLGQDNALAALDEPGTDLSQSAPMMLIENRLVDSDDVYASLETVDAEGPGKAESESFDVGASSGETAPQQILPLEDDDIVDLEPIETLEAFDEETDSPVPSLNALPLAASPKETESGAEDSPSDDGVAKTGRLKSLFGRFGRKKDTAEAASETVPADELTPAAPAPATELVAEAQSDAEARAVAAEPEEPSADLVVPTGGEVWEPPEDEWEADDDDELVSVEDMGPVDEDLVEDFDEVEELVEEEEPDAAQPADEGFADFLNELDEPQ